MLWLLVFWVCTHRPLQKKKLNHQNKSFRIGPAPILCQISIQWNKWDNITAGQRRESVFNISSRGNYSKWRKAAGRKKTCKCCVILSRSKMNPEGSCSRELAKPWPWCLLCSICFRGLEYPVLPACEAPPGCVGTLLWAKLSIQASDSFIDSTLRSSTSYKNC